ncbi:MAG: PadR family transcriptional regulator [Propionibacteriales bacterium]|nr:PadR family transcriptional regulator [Propionibacteriales bacterium]
MHHRVAGTHLDHWIHRREDDVAKRGDALELAVLGLLHEVPMHGYELRKRVTGLLGWGRMLSYGSLYPCLKHLLRTGLIAEDTAHLDVATMPGARVGRRGKIVYKLTAEGKERFATLVSAAGSSAWEDDNFGVHFAFFGATSRETRLRILEGRRTRLEERLEGVRTALSRSREHVDAYTFELQRHGLETAEREVGWLTKLIDSERVEQKAVTPADGETASTTSIDGTPSGASNRE